MNVEVRDHDIRIRTDKEIALKLGARYIKENLYRLPKTIDAVKDLMQYSNNITLSQLHEVMDKTQRLLMHLKKQEDLPLPGFEMLRPYQRVDLFFLSKLPHGAIFNEQRTGKTPTLLSLIKLKQYKKNLLIVPAGLKLNWEKECKVWLPGIKTFVIRGPKKQRERAYQKVSEQESYVMIVSYDTLKQKGEIETILDLTRIIKFDSISVDEAHNIRNRKSQRTIAIKEIGKFAEHRYALTGTPAVRHGFDVHSILHFLYPEKFSSYWAFLDRYFEMKKDVFSGTMQPTGAYKRKEELEGMLSLMGTNRKRREVMEWLPDKQYTVIPIELTPRQQKAYEDVYESFRYEENGEMLVDASSVLSQLIRLRQICLAPSMLGIKAPSAKEEFLLEWLQDNKEPVIIFSQFTSYLKELQKKITENLKEPVVMIHGELSAKQKEESVEAFQQGKARILLANIKAGAVGFTLDKAEVTIFMDKEWNPADNLQAEDRMVPVSKERMHKMDVISLVAADTIDEKIEKLLEHKYNIVEVVNSGGLNALDRIYKELMN